MINPRLVQWLISSIPLFFLACTGSEIATATKTAEEVFHQNTAVTSAEVAQGLKEALMQGVSKGTQQASQIDGYFRNSLLKILIPPDMQQVSQKLRSLGMNTLMDEFELSLNRGAEEAAQKAKPIFLNTITSMTIQDAWSILKGNQDAATVYLSRSTHQQLYDAFRPVIHNSLNNVNATKYYASITTAYNQLPMVQKVSTDLDNYVTNKAIDGLFVLIRQEELNIRTNASARSTELLKRVFAQENMK